MVLIPIFLLLRTCYKKYNNEVPPIRVDYSVIAKKIIDDKLMGPISEKNIKLLLEDVKSGHITKKKFNQIIASYLENRPSYKKYPQLVSELERQYGLKATEADSLYKINKKRININNQ